MARKSKDKGKTKTKPPKKLSFLLDPFDLPPWSPPLAWTLLSGFFDFVAMKWPPVNWFATAPNQAPGMVTGCPE
jgi:hypothetical protein